MGTGLALATAMAAQDALMRATTVHLQASGLRPSARPSLAARASDQPLLDLTGTSRARRPLKHTRHPARASVVRDVGGLPDQVLFWFANPEQRTGPHLNYAACRTRARVTIHPSGHTVLDCRTRPGPPLLRPSEAREDVP